MAEKANHHIVPQFYLRNFATGSGRKARITAFESKTGLSFKTAVRNVGAIRHFNRIEVQGQDPNALENALAEVEAQIAPALDAVIAAASFPTENHKELVDEI